MTHHPLLTYGGSSLWIKLLQHAGLDPLKLVKEYSDELLQNLITFADSNVPGELSQAHYFALSALTIIAPDEMGPKLIEIVKTAFLNADYSQIRQKDCEIYGTPEGVMHTDGKYPHIYKTYMI